MANKTNIDSANGFISYAIVAQKDSNENHGGFASVVQIFGTCFNSS